MNIFAAYITSILIFLEGDIGMGVVSVSYTEGFRIKASIIGDELFVTLPFKRKYTPREIDQHKASLLSAIYVALFIHNKGLLCGCIQAFIYSIRARKKLRKFLGFEN